MEDSKQKMDKTLSVVSEDMATIRVGGAKPAMVEHIDVEAYGPGQRMKLVELASISAPDPQQIIISPWDKSVIRAVERAILESGLGLMPNVNGEIIRIIIPPLTQERRLEFVKLVHQKLESGRVMFRNLRQELKEEIEAQKGTSGVSEDDIEAELVDLQKLVDEYMAKLEAMASEKEEEIMRL